MKDFTNKYSWLYSKNNCLGCTTCRAAKLAPGHMIQEMSFPMQWCDATVQPYGDGRPAQLKSLRKKTAEHKESKIHKLLSEILLKRSDDVLPHMMNQATERENEIMVRVFRTAYFLMKKKQPFTDFPHLIDLQQLNEADMGHVLHSRVSAADICDHIGNEMRKNVVKAIKDSREKIGIMIDEATTNSLKSSLVVCLRFFCMVSPHPCFWI